jgi:hypothetical protein
MLSLFQDYLDDPRQFASVKDLYSNYQRHVSVTGGSPLVHLLILGKE